MSARCDEPRIGVSAIRILVKVNAMPTLRQFANVDPHDNACIGRIGENDAADFITACVDKQAGGVGPFGRRQFFQELARCGVLIGTT